MYKLVSESGHTAMYGSKSDLEVIRLEWAHRWPGRKFEIVEA